MDIEKIITSQQFNYIGDSVNLASILDDQSKLYGVKIVLGSLTTKYIQDGYFVLQLDCIAVTGKKKGVNIFAVLETDAGAMVEYILSRELHDLILDYYRKQKWASALHYIEELKGEFDGKLDHYYEMMIERIGELREQNLPTDLDGVYRDTSK